MICDLVECLGSIITTTASELSHAVAPCVEADIPAVLPVHHDTQHANISATRQDPPPRLLKSLSQEDIVVKGSTIFQVLLRRRNSAPAPTPAAATSPITVEREQGLAAAFDLVHTEHCLVSIQLPNDEPRMAAVAPASFTPAEQQPDKPSQKRQFHCDICATTLPDEADPDFIRQVIKPCWDWECDSSFCRSCIRQMFVQTCTDITRMPPRCCVAINLSYAKPHLTQDEIQLFQAKYEEWSTPNPFYCPVATCSAFIPDQFLPGRTKRSGKRIDSGDATPPSKTFPCPTCEAIICLECRKLAHPCSPCNVSESGLDEDTSRLLKSWGYKQCPKCRHGLKRINGCNHIECHCGAHFCYLCMGDPLACWGYHPPGDDEDDDDDDGNENSCPPGDTNESENQPETATISGETGNAQTENQNNETPTAPPVQSRNLDAGSSMHWMNKPPDLDEGPGQKPPDPYWNCAHTFEPFEMDLVKVPKRDACEAVIDCVRCWRTTYPIVVVPLKHSLLTTSTQPSLSPSISLTHKCMWCKLLVCDSCSRDLAAEEEEGEA